MPRAAGVNPSPLATRGGLKATPPWEINLSRSVGSGLLNDRRQILVARAAPRRPCAIDAAMKSGVLGKR